MKKIKYLVIAVFTFLFFFNVEAIEYKEMMLIPVDTVATVKSGNFDYIDFSYSSTLNEKGNATVYFTSINNKSTESQYVSIDILLFDANQKNIGFLTYCTDQDVSSNYSDFKLGAGQATAFQINVVPKYFVTDKAPKDVKYIAVMDDNKYCHIGGYDKYAQLTVDQISSGELNVPENSTKKTNGLYKYLNGKGIVTIVVILFLTIIGYVIYGVVLNALYKRMFGATTPLAYIPIANFYVAFKLAFGNLPALIFLGAYFVAILLSFVGVGFIVVTILSIVSGVAFILDIVKLITKRYDLLYYEPKVNNVAGANQGYNNQNNYNVSSNDSVGFGIKKALGKSKDNSSSSANTNDANNILSSFLGGSVDDSEDTQSNNSFNVSQGNSGKSNNDIFNVMQGDSDKNSSDNSVEALLGGSQKSSDNKSNNSSEGESDLSKFFN